MIILAAKRLTKKQQQLDINGDGKIDAEDLKRLRNGEKPKKKVTAFERADFNVGQAIYTALNKLDPQLSKPKRLQNLQQSCFEFVSTQTLGISVVLKALAALDPVASSQTSDTVRFSYKSKWGCQYGEEFRVEVVENRITVYVG